MASRKHALKTIAGMDSLGCPFAGDPPRRHEVAIVGVLQGFFDKLLDHGNAFGAEIGCNPENAVKDDRRQILRFSELM
jgi:hypothetical protein